MEENFPRYTEQWKQSNLNGGNIHFIDPITSKKLTFNLTEATVVTLQETYPARLVITTDGLLVSNNTVRLLEQSAPAGVAIDLAATYGSLTPFAVAPDPGDTDPAPEGFSEPNYAPDAGLGGQLTEKFS